MNREQYEKDLAERQRKHLEKVRRWTDNSSATKYVSNWRACMHDQCSRCEGTGVQLDGQKCIHMISCPCPRCTMHM